MCIRDRFEADEPEGAQNKGAEQPDRHRDRRIGRKPGPEDQQGEQDERQDDEDQVDQQRAEPERRACDAQLQVDPFGRHEFAQLLFLRRAHPQVARRAQATFSRRGM